MVSCVQGFLSLHHRDGLSQASVQSVCLLGLSDAIGSQVPFVMGSPLGSSQCRLAFGSASSPVIIFFLIYLFIYFFFE